LHERAAAADGPGNIFVGLAPGYRPGDGAQAGDAPSVPRRRPGGGRRVRVRRPAHPTSPRYPASRPGPGAASPIGFEAIRPHPAATSANGIRGKPGCPHGYAGVQAVITDIPAGTPDIRAAACPRCGALEANR